MNPIAANLTRIRETIAAAAQSCGRAPADIKLIAVSKTHPIAKIDTAMDAGQIVYAENTVQEALPKITHFAARGLEWHFIGHLQSNKAKFIPGHFSWLHSLDNANLAQRLSRLAQEKRVTLNALVEINITGDTKKHGIAADALFTLLDQLLDETLPGIRLRGLMTIAPFPAATSEIRNAFAALRALRDDCVQRFGLSDFTELSMGMSGDYVEAIKEGSTMVRIGTAIFGERDYAHR
ncbi:MAG: YggS family pyridoxal phosphate-dependent enzyme [Sulfurifustis sp.]